MIFDEEIVARLREAGVDAALAHRLAAYGRLVLEANRSMNLTAARDSNAFSEHILDALTLRGDVDGPFIDLGSGAGLPGIPLAIATGQRVVLVDAIKKKAHFLASTLAALGIDGEARDDRAESLARNPAYRERFRCATARAVSTAPSTAELAVPFLAIGGRALLQRGAIEERERQAVSDAALVLGSEFVEERAIAGERRLIVLIKRSPTQQRFPRREGVPQKRPLCLM